jgi:CHAT domain-containing protein/Tfp pilus assembly protein PilF
MKQHKLIALILGISVLICLISNSAPSVAIDMKRLAELDSSVEELVNAKKYSEALPLAKELVSDRQLVYGETNSDTISATKDLADIYLKTGDFTNAEHLYQRSLHIIEKIAGPENADVATLLGSLALLYIEMGDYMKAETLCQRSLNIREKLLGLEHPDTIVSLNNLALIYDYMGNYAKAESLYQKDLQIIAKISGQESLDYAKALNNLACLYSEMGDYHIAESFYLRSLQIQNRVYGPGHPDTATTIDNLAGVYHADGNFAAAEPLYQKSVQIMNNFLGPENPDTCTALNNLAGLYCSMGDYEKAKPIYQRNLQAMLKMFGPEHPNTAAAFNNLAALYGYIGNHNEAVSFFQRSLQIQSRTLGLEHPDTLTTINNLSFELIKQGNLGLALDYARKGQIISEHILGNVLAFASEHQRFEYNGTQTPYALLATLGSPMYLAETIIHNKGIILDSELEDKLIAAKSPNQEIRNQIDELNNAGRLLYKIQMSTPDEFLPTRITNRQEQMQTKATQVEELQKELALNFASVGQTRRSLKLKLREVEETLKSDTVLLEYIRYENIIEGKNQYGVLIIDSQKVALKDASAVEPIWVQLGAATEIDAKLQQYITLMRSHDRGDVGILKTLCDQIMAPVLKHLPNGVTNLIISPDAELNFLSFATLIDPQDRFLAERYRIKYVASGRDLVYGRMVTNANPELAVFANPEFDQAPGATPLPHTNTVNLAMLGTDQRDYNGYSLASLPNTEQEARFLSSKSSDWHLKPSIFTGSAATEAQVKALHSPYILHLATHGFFLPDTEPTNQPPHLSLDRKLPVVLHNPMQRSGLALAGAQVTLEAWKRGEVPDPDNDGILMAQEVGLLDLQNTWLVTLSACDTGIGEARAGEGVMGLRRGFIQAGAQNLLMTLWPVSDKWTADLMAAFYDRAMKTRNAPDALAEVQREYLIKLKQEKNPVMAARLAGPFVMNFQGRPGNN